MFTATAGAFLAARRASAIRPMEALRETSTEPRAMTLSRWLFAVASLAGAAALAPQMRTEAGAAYLLIVAILLTLAGALLAPALVRPVVLALGVGARGPVRLLAHRSALADARRTAATPYQYSSPSAWPRGTCGHRDNIRRPGAKCPRPHHRAAGAHTRSRPGIDQHHGRRRQRRTRRHRRRPGQAHLRPRSHRHAGPTACRVVPRRPACIPCDAPAHRLGQPDHPHRRNRRPVILDRRGPWLERWQHGTAVAQQRCTDPPSGSRHP
jgi:hypothetical protein